MTRQNLLTSFLIVVVSILALGIGSACFGLGLILAIPATSMLWIVALRVLSGQPIEALETELDQTEEVFWT